MTIRLSVAVQHHPSRTHLLPALLAALEPLDIDVITDPDPDGRPSPWRCYRECLERLPGWATHHLIVQDDAVPCAGFAQAAVAAITARPDRPIAFFVGGTPRDLAIACLKAGKVGERWCDLSPFSAAFPCVAASWPTGLIPQILAWADANRLKPEKDISDDGILARFLQAKRIYPWATVPSLVEHPNVEVSIIGRNARGARDPGRVACMAPPENASLIQW